MREGLIICALVMMLGFINALIWFSRAFTNTQREATAGGLIFSGVLVVVGFFGGLIVILALAPR
jgi:hypothetical protein